MYLGGLGPGKEGLRWRAGLILLFRLSVLELGGDGFLFPAMADGLIYGRMIVALFAYCYC